MSRGPKTRPKIDGLLEREEPIGRIALEGAQRSLELRVCKDEITLVYTHRTITTRLQLTHYEAGWLAHTLAAYDEGTRIPCPDCKGLGSVFGRDTCGYCEGEGSVDVDVNDRNEQPHTGK